MDKGEDQLKAVYFAAGMAAFMACIERAAMESVFVHWHVWAFLVLNLLLLAILFTSKAQSNEVVDQEDGAEVEGKKEKEECRSSLTNEDVEVVKMCVQYETRKSIATEDDDQMISKEELNQRAEAFIAMFRQHLVSDAKSSRLQYQPK